jgi:Raf kinase inhibitor-like YbhB/YbcL family protein
MTVRILGNLLRGVRAGDRYLACNHPALTAAPATIRLHSKSFASDELMPLSCAGPGVGPNNSPQLAWSGVPAGTQELVLIMQDPDVPLPKPVVHLIAHGIAPAQSSFAESTLSQGTGGDIRFGAGSFGRQGYQGPRPVPGHGPHRYVFQMIALGSRLDFIEPPKLGAVLAAAGGNVLASGQLVGLFER